MGMMTWAANPYGGVRCMGLCHGVQGGHHQIARALGKRQDQVDIIAAGINHQTWFLRVLDEGREAAGEELVRRFEAHPEHSRTGKVRIDGLKRFGCHSAESNGRLSEGKFCR
jgi:alpha-galactosidase